MKHLERKVLHFEQPGPYSPELEKLRFLKLKLKLTLIANGNTDMTSSIRVAEHSPWQIVNGKIRIVGNRYK